MIAAQSHDKSIFEYWTHALAYVPTRDYRFFINRMNRYKKDPGDWYGDVKKGELQKVLRLIKKDGALSIRDIEDDVLVEKDHPWASKKPSKRALQLGFHIGSLVISERLGMLKKYELTERHFEWDKKPKSASEKEVREYLLDRALRSQTVVSLDSICHLYPSQKPEMKKLIEKRVNAKELVAVTIEAKDKKIPHWIQAKDLDEAIPGEHGLTHILSPFDPLTIQRKRLEMLFDYEHRFEAYLPKEKRVFGYFALPVLMGDEIVSAIDLKTDRAQKKLLVQQWTWTKKAKSVERKKAIEEALHRFEKFQLG